MNKNSSAERLPSPRTPLPKPKPSMKLRFRDFIGRLEGDGGLSNESGLFKTAVDVSSLSMIHDARNNLQNRICLASPRLKAHQKTSSPRLPFHISTARLIQPNSKQNIEIKGQTARSRLLENDSNVRCRDSTQPELRGAQAVRSFYLRYRDLDKIVDQNQSFGVQNTSVTQLLSSLASEQLLPRRCGLVTESGNPHELSISHHGLGDKYVEALSPALKTFSKLTFRDNRISAQGARSLANGLHKNLVSLDCSRNKIGDVGCFALVKSIRNEAGESLRDVILERSRLTAKSVPMLLQSLDQCTQIARLSLAYNSLTDSCAENLRDFVMYNGTLNELCLRWNDLGRKTGAAIAEGLFHSSSLRVLDLSWNAFGGEERNQIVATKWSSALSENKVLLHLDLSYNGFLPSEVEVLSRGLAENRTLLGIHFDGHGSIVDGQGFIRAIRTGDPQDLEFRISSVRKIRKRKDRVPTNCWICEGWQEHIFLLNASNGSFLHLEHEGFKPIPLEDGAVRRMLPPGCANFFFSLDAKTPALTKILTKDSAIYATLNENGVTHNTIDITFHDPVVDTENYSIGITTQPRGPDYMDQRSKEIQSDTKKGLVKTKSGKQLLRPKRSWSFPESIFRDWRREDDEHLRRCFEFDWSCSKIARLTKDESILAKVKDQLWLAYRPLKDLYRYLAGLGVIGEVFSIPINTFTEFAVHSGIIDERYKLSDLDLKFVATNASEIKTRFNPERALTRFKFLEILVRIADDKFLKTKFSPSLDLALSTLLERILPMATQHNFQIWRESRYWVEEVDRVFRMYYPLVMALYKNYSGQTSKQRRFISLVEFHSLVNATGLLDDETLVERDLGVVFNISMMTQVDEIRQSRHLEMSFVEFLEALARLADKAGLQPIEGSQFEESGSLCSQLESLLAVMYTKCFEDSSKETLVPHGSPIAQFRLPTLVKSPRRINLKPTNTNQHRKIIKRITSDESLKATE